MYSYTGKNGYRYYNEQNICYKRINDTLDIEFSKTYKQIKRARKPSCANFFYKDIKAFHKDETLWTLLPKQPLLSVKEFFHCLQVLLLCLLLWSQILSCAGESESTSKIFCNQFEKTLNFSIMPKLFCDHYNVMYLFKHWNDKGKVSLPDYQKSLDDILRKDKEASVKYKSFSLMMKQYATPCNYSIRWHEQDCQVNKTKYKV